MPATPIPDDVPAPGPAGDGPPDCWLAHEDPRPLGWGAWLCDCDGCAAVLAEAARHDPRLPIVLKTELDRVVVTARRAVAVRRAHGSLDPLLWELDDHIREVFVGAVHLPRDVTYWSLARAEHRARTDPTAPPVTEIDKRRAFPPGFAELLELLTDEFGAPEVFFRVPAPAPASPSVPRRPTRSPRSRPR